MASPSFEIGRPSSVATEITRTLERCVKESRAVDTESLCIIAGEKVSVCGLYYSMGGARISKLLVWFVQLGYFYH